jgi:hypothetical protein
VKRSLILSVVALLALLGGFAAAAFASTSVAVAAAPAATPDPGLLDLARPVYEAVLHGQWYLAAALALVLVVALVRRYAGPRVPFLHSDAGGALLALVGSYGGAVATALAAGGAVFSAHLAWVALTVAIAAAGGYSLIKKLIITPFLVPWAAKAPAWLKPLLAIVIWIFERPDPVSQATAAGDAAVAAHPSTGVGGILGKADEIK